MARSCFLVILLLASIFLLSIPQGDARRFKLLRRFQKEYSSNPSVEGIQGVEREMMGVVMDYKDPEANTNQKGGTFNSPSGSFHTP